MGRQKCDRPWVQPRARPGGRLVAQRCEIDDALVENVLAHLSADHLSVSVTDTSTLPTSERDRDYLTALRAWMQSAVSEDWRDGDSATCVASARVSSNVYLSPARHLSVPQGIGSGENGNLSCAGAGQTTGRKAKRGWEPSWTRERPGPSVLGDA